LKLAKPKRRKGKKNRWTGGGGGSLYVFTKKKKGSFLGRENRITVHLRGSGKEGVQEESHLPYARGEGETDGCPLAWKREERGTSIHKPLAKKKKI